MIAHPIPNRGGNFHVHENHPFTEEDHIEAGDVDELDARRRPWALLLYGVLAAMTFLLVLMIANS